MSLVQRQLPSPPHSSSNFNAREPPPPYWLSNQPPHSSSSSSSLSLQFHNISIQLPTVYRRRPAPPPPPPSRGSFQQRHRAAQRLSLSDTDSDDDDEERERRFRIFTPPRRPKNEILLGKNLKLISNLILSQFISNRRRSLLSGSRAQLQVPAGHRG